MIYKKQDYECCRICANCTPDGNGNVNCKYTGTVPADYHCKKFEYDIFKRQIIPKIKKKKPVFSQKDFTI